jgi:hypothetical protein
MTAVKGRKSIKKRRAARAARQAAATPAPPKVPSSQKVEITGPAKVDHDDPEFGEVRSDHEGAVGELESTYYNPERGQHMGRVRVGQKADGTAGQLRGIPLDRLAGIKGDAPTTAVGAPPKQIRSGPAGISQKRWEEIFGKRDNNNLMDDEKAAASREELRRLNAEINGA